MQKNLIFMIVILLFSGCTYIGDVDFIGQKPIFISNSKKVLLKEPDTKQCDKDSLSFYSIKSSQSSRDISNIKNTISLQKNCFKNKKIKTIENYKIGTFTNNKYHIYEKTRKEDDHPKAYYIGTKYSGISAYHMYASNTFQELVNKIDEELKKGRCKQIITKYHEWVHGRKNNNTTIWTVFCPKKGLSDFLHNLNKSSLEKNRENNEACENNSLLACKNLGDFYSKDKELQDYSMAMRYYRKACLGGDASSCLNIADMYYLKKITKRDGNIEFYYQKACDGGESKGCKILKIIKEEAIEKKRQQREIEKEKQEKRKKAKLKKAQDKREQVKNNPPTRRVYTSPLEKELARVVSQRYGNVDFSWKCKSLGNYSPYSSCFVRTSIGARFVITCTTVGAIQCGNSSRGSITPNIGVPNLLKLPW